METIKEILYFDSVKLVTVRNLKLGLLHRTLQLCVIAYIAVFAIWYKGGYQESSEISGVIYTKVKGVSHESITGLAVDASDLVIPGSENAAIFLATRSLSTIQTHGICPDASSKTDNNCKTASDCKEGAFTSNGWVVANQCDMKLHKCNVSAWCPIEDELLPFTVYNNIENFTLFIRSEVVYDKWNIRASNAAEVKPGINLFKVSEILNGTDVQDALVNGSIINIQLDWSCNLDQDTCLPKFSFTRIDDGSRAASHGFNFRRSLYFNNDLNMTTPTAEVYKTRVLTKFYGLRFVLQIKGLGRKFDVFSLAITVGSGLAFFAVATLTTDVFLQYCHPNKDRFKKAKHNSIRFDEEEATNLMVQADNSPRTTLD